MRRAAAAPAVFLLAVFAAALAVASDIPGKVVLKVYPAKTVAFNHKGHAERIKDCRKCHHQDSPGEEVKCSECHSAKPDGATPSFREAMHFRCKTCHAKDNRKVRGACKECHPNIK